MNQSMLDKIFIGCITVVGIFALGVWFTAGLPMEIEERVPGMDNSGSIVTAQRTLTGPEGELIKSDGVPADLTGIWPWFRGEDLDNIYKENVNHIPAGETLPEQWGIDVGEGFAGAVIRDGRVYMLDYDRENQADAIRCLSLADGKEIWRYTYPVTVKRNHGMSRTIPAVTDDVVITIGPKCHVNCLDRITGEKKWSLDLVFKYDAEVPPWYVGQCPLIDQGRLILAPGGKTLIVALDLQTGEPIWESANPKQWDMTHSSVMPMMFNGKRIYVYCASGGVVGVSADDGSILWDYPDWTIRIANVPSPLVIGEDQIFLSGGYKAGSVMLQLVEENNQIIPKTLFRLEPEIFGSTQHTPILYKDHIYGVRPDGELVCLGLDGNEVWTSTSAHKFGLGPYIIIDSMIYVMNDTGLMSRVEATHEEFRLIDQHEVLHGHDAWAPFAFASGKLILRDLTRMVCLDIVAN